jgi:hypothetical protein
MDRVPQRCADIDAAFLNQALSPALRGGEPITAVDVQIIGEGVGFVGELARVSLSYDSPPACAITSLIAKVPTTNVGFKHVGMLLGLYEKEHGFYQHVAHRVTISVPTAYFNHADKERQEFMLLMQDMAPMRPGNQLESCSLAEAEMILREVASFHATWWAHPELESFAEWLPTSGSPYMYVAEGAYRQSLPTLRPNFGFFLSDHVIETAERLLPVFHDASAAGPFREPHTFIHGDFRLDNMMFGPDGEFAMLDWQLPFKANALWDVTYFLAGNFEPAWRQAHQDHLVHVYHDALLAAGVTAYPFEQCWEDYRANGLVLLSYLVTTAADVDFSTFDDRGRELIVQMWSRLGVFVDDMGSAEFIP